MEELTNRKQAEYLITDMIHELDRLGDYLGMLRTNVEWNDDATEMQAECLKRKAKIDKKFMETMHRVDLMQERIDRKRA